ncbi:hypothetical protein DSCW_52560 [Desulfosarcina widdelii]|uniref:Uncharacterized protein n=1 Tax=Desulfosarcina widdelii TaxID=947919 RepID=A0A5K7ZCE5_9BACT|nr:hypothetical protein DSCW_52560 [Desulfosarcina widdelii]
MRRTRNKQMHMFFPYVPSYYLNFQFGAYISHDLPKPQGNLAPKQLLPVLRDPDQMIFDVESGMSGAPVVFHTPFLLKLSPEGEGFNIPKRDY